MTATKPVTWAADWQLKPNEVIAKRIEGNEELILAGWAESLLQYYPADPAQMTITPADDGNGLLMVKITDHGHDDGVTGMPLYVALAYGLKEAQRRLAEKV